MSRMLFWALFLLPLTSAVSQFEKFLIQERWLPPKEQEWGKWKHLNVSSACSADLDQWLSGLEAFARDFQLCFVHNPKNCSAETKADLKKNIYALKQLDAFGRLPPGILDIDLTQAGSEYECNEVRAHYVYKTHYCFVYSAFGKNANCDGVNGQNIAAIKKAVCMPATCTEEDILSFWKTFHDIGGLTHCAAECVPESGHTNAFFWVFVSFMIALVALCISASIVDFVRDSYLEKSAKDAKGTALKLLLCFSYYTNGHTILDTTPAREGHLKSLDCIRFFSMLWVVSGHVALQFSSNDVVLPLLTLLKPIAADTIGSAFFSVDTFFVLSGLLVSYLFFKQTAKNPKIVKNPVTWVLFYVHRYLRLTPPYMLFIGYFIAFTPLIVGQISLIMQTAVVADICAHNWWRNLIYISNFDSAKQCYGITWYLAADTQMYIVAPVFLVALFLNHLIGVAVMLAAMAGSVGITFYWIYKDNLGGNIIRAGARGMEFYDKLYAMPWVRITPYLVGIYVGYLLARFPKSKRPKMHFVIPIVGWIVAIGIALACIYGPHDYIDFEQNWSKFVSAFYYSFSRIGWALFICYVIAANYYGYGGPIAVFMDHPLWQPFGRLSYCAYLVHFYLITYYLNMLDRPLHFTTLLKQFQTTTMPITVMAYIFAFGWSCTCELPFLRLEKMGIDALIGGRRRGEVKPEEKVTVEGGWDEAGEEEISEKL